MECARPWSRADDSKVDYMKYHSKHQLKILIASNLFANAKTLSNIHTSFKIVILHHQ